MAVLLENDTGIFTFLCWILVIGRYAIMFRFGTIFLALTVYERDWPPRKVVFSGWPPIII